MYDKCQRYILWYYNKFFSFAMMLLVLEAVAMVGERIYFCAMLILAFYIWGVTICIKGYLRA